MKPLFKFESNICETTASNIFIVTDKHLITPPLSSGCVNGIVRNKLLKMLLHGDIH